MKRILALAPLFIACSGSDVGVTEDAIKDRSSALDDFFVIAADYQPHQNFDTWKKRGVNTMIRVPNNDSIGDWTQKANQLGLKMIREPRNDPKDDLGEKNLLAWHLADEPELHQTPVSSIKDEASKLRNIDPNRPLSINFWGGGILQNADGCFGSYCYEDYIKHADWVSDDIYPCNKYGCDIDVVGRALTRLRHWTDAPRRAFAYIETSDWDGNGTGPSARRWRAEVFDAIIHGARGVFYFAVRLQNGHCCADYDATPGDVADEMKIVHPRLEKLARVLQGQVDPPGASMNVDHPLEVGWRHGKDGWYFIVLNTSDKTVKNAHLRLHGVHPSKADVLFSSRVLNVNGDNDIVADFDPYEEHVYRVQ